MPLFKVKCGVGSAKRASSAARASCGVACLESNAGTWMCFTAPRISKVAYQSPCHSARLPRQCCMRRSRPSAFAGKAESSSRASPSRHAVPLWHVVRLRGKDDRRQFEAQRNRLQARLRLTTIGVMGPRPMVVVQASWSAVRPEVWRSRSNHSFEPTRSSIGPLQALWVLSFRGPMPPRAAQLQR